ncbi:MAG TPA: stage II sporulation protein M [Burkholderiales bacterium]|nr:stage II sporulation protein M [Burkholderiales bacterium]
MKQAIFETRYAEDWNRFETWLQRREKSSRRKKGKDAEAETANDTEIPQLYRRVCQHLALARDRHYSPDLVDRLNRLALRGHHVLYGVQPRSLGVIDFLTRGFPRLIRAERKVVIAACLLFFGPLAGIVAVLQWHPEFIYYLADPAQLREYQSMYDPEAQKEEIRGADSNVQMFGLYIWNNIRIGFQTFATGLFFGVGSLLVLLFNAVMIGAVAGYLHSIGYGSTFWPFVSGHSAFELTAIAISAAAGFKLGGALIAPGALTRKMALVMASQTAVRLMYGAALMLLGAAFIEAFWSPHHGIPSWIKYSVGIGFWVLLALYFFFAGRKEASEHGT